MDKKVTIAEISNFILNLGFPHNIQKMLKEPERNKDGIWAAIVFLAKSAFGIPNVQLNSIAPQAYMHIQTDKHEQATEWANQYSFLDICFKKLNIKYAVSDYLSGNKDSACLALALLMKYKIMKGQVLKKIQKKAANVTMFEEQLKKHNRDVDNLEAAYCRMKEKKQEEQPQFKKLLQKKAEKELRIQSLKNQRKEMNVTKTTLQEEVEKLIAQDGQKKLEIEQIKRVLEQTKKKVVKNFQETKQQLNKLQNLNQQMIFSAKDLIENRKLKLKISNDLHENTHKIIQNFRQNVSSISQSQRDVKWVKKQYDENNLKLSQINSKKTPLNSKIQIAKGTIVTLEQQYQLINSTSLRTKTQNKEIQNGIQIVSHNNKNMLNNVKQIQRMIESEKRQSMTLVDQIGEMKRKFTNECNNIQRKAQMYLRQKTELVSNSYMNQNLLRNY